MKTQNTENEKHTHGPWEVEHERNKFDSACDELVIVSPALDFTHGGKKTSVPRIVLARINVRAFAPHMAEPEANACLMGAAPDLLTALERLIEESEGAGLNYPPSDFAITQAKAAIAKARGQQ